MCEPLARIIRIFSTYSNNQKTLKKKYDFMTFLYSIEHGTQKSSSVIRHISLCDFISI